MRLVRRDQAAIDPYTFVREAWRQQRTYEIHDGNPPERKGDEFDEFLNIDSEAIGILKKSINIVKRPSLANVNEENYEDPISNTGSAPLEIPSRLASIPKYVVHQHQGHHGFSYWRL